MVRPHLCLVLGTQFKKEVVKEKKPPADRYCDGHRLKACDPQGQAGEAGLLSSDKEETKVS